MTDCADNRGCEPELHFDIAILIRHPTLDGRRITSEIGLEPKTVHAVAAPRFTPRQRQLSGVYTETRWMWGERVQGSRDFFGAIAEIVGRLAPRRQFLQFVSETGGSTTVIVNLAGGLNIGSEIAWHDIARLAELRVGLGIEVFPEVS